MGPGVLFIRPSLVEHSVCPGFFVPGVGGAVHEIRQKSQKFLHKYNKTGKLELTRYTTATVNLWLEWENVCCSLPSLPLLTGDECNINCQIGVHAQTPGGVARAPVPQCPIAGDANVSIYLKSQY